MTTKVIRAQEAARLPAYTFPGMEQTESLPPAAAGEASASATPARDEAPPADEVKTLPPAPPAHELLLQQAQMEAERCLSAAQERAAALEAAGYKAGLKKGEETARGEVQAQFASVLTSLQNAAVACASLHQDICQRAEAELIDFAFHIARQIIHHEATCNPEILATTLRRAFAYVMDRQRVVVRVSPTDLQRALALKADLLQSVDGLKHLSIEGDEAVSPGGCLLETSCGEIDARLEAQFEELEQRFREHYRLMSEASVS
jgi:flagellar assembly protein FliH